MFFHENDKSGKLKVQIIQLVYISRPPKLLRNCVMFPFCRTYVTDFTKGVKEQRINPSVKNRKKTYHENSYVQGKRCYIFFQKWCLLDVRQGPQYVSE